MARIVPVHAQSDATHRHGREARAGTARRTASTAALTALAAALALCLGACAQLLGIDELSPGDAGPSSFRVRGLAVGVVDPVSLRLEHDGGDELLTVAQDGPFEFATELATGTAYAVTLAVDADCMLANASGNAGAAPDVELACGPALLSSLSLSGVAVPAIDFNIARSTYDVEVSLLQQSVQVIATAARPEASVTVDGAPLANGETSAPLPLGDNRIEIVVSAGNVKRTYELDVRRGTTVAQHAYAKASNAEAGDQLGYSLALSGDTLAVGAPFEDSPATGVNNGEGNGLTDSGAVYVFRRDGDVWKQEAYLKASNTGAGDDFGHSVDLAGDLLVVGAPLEDGAATGVDGPDNDDAGESGAAYVFRRSGDAWQQDAYLKPSNADAGDNFGWSVAIDGDTVVVGAPLESSDGSGPADDTLRLAGAAYVFRHDGTWTQEAYLKASNPGEEDQFGRSLTVHGDTLAVGVRLEDGASTGVNGEQENGVLTNSGAVYVFRRAGADWAQEAYIKASNTGVDDQFGLSVALEGDTLAVGAPFEDSGATGVGGNDGNDSSEDSGAVYVFRYTDTGWIQEAYVKASNTGSTDNFGWSVDLAGDLLAVGATEEDSASQGPGGNQGDDGPNNDSGAAYVFHRDDSGWTQQAYVKASNAEAGDSFGYSVALSGDTLAIAAHEEDGVAKGVGGDEDTEGGADDSGALYILH